MKCKYCQILASKRDLVCKEAVFNIDIPKTDEQPRLFIDSRISKFDDGSEPLITFVGLYKDNDFFEESYDTNWKYCPMCGRKLNRKEKKQ